MRTAGPGASPPAEQLEPIDTDLGDPWVREIFEIMAPLCGEAPVPRGLAYFTEAAALVPAYGTPPTIICGPGDADEAHRTEESCSIAALEAAADGILRSHAAGAGAESGQRIQRSGE